MSSGKGTRRGSGSRVQGRVQVPHWHGHWAVPVPTAPTAFHCGPPRIPHGLIRERAHSESSKGRKASGNSPGVFKGKATVWCFKQSSLFRRVPEGELEVLSQGGLFPKGSRFRARKGSPGAEPAVCKKHIKLLTASAPSSRPETLAVTKACGVQRERGQVRVSVCEREWPERRTDAQTGQGLRGARVWVCTPGAWCLWDKRAEGVAGHGWAGLSPHCPARAAEALVRTGARLPLLPQSSSCCPGNLLLSLPRS